MLVSTLAASVTVTVTVVCLGGWDSGSPAFARFIMSPPQVQVVWAGEAGEAGCVRAEAVCHGVELLLEVGTEMVGDVMHQEVYVPGDVVVRVNGAVDLVVLDFVACLHGQLVYEGHGDRGGLDDCPLDHAD